VSWFIDTANSFIDIGKWGLHTNTACHKGSTCLSINNNNNNNNAYIGRRILGIPLHDGSILTLLNRYMLAAVCVLSVTLSTSVLHLEFHENTCSFENRATQMSAREADRPDRIMTDGVSIRSAHVMGYVCAPSVECAALFTGMHICMFKIDHHLS